MSATPRREVPPAASASTTRPPTSTTATHRGDSHPRAAAAAAAAAAQEQQQPNANASASALQRLGLGLVRPATAATLGGGAAPKMPRWGDANAADADRIVRLLATPRAQPPPPPLSLPLPRSSRSSSSSQQPTPHPTTPPPQGITNNLSPEQQAVVRAPVDGNDLTVRASAGAGKTAELTARMLRLVSEEGVDPRHVLAITFTKRATAEMSARITRALGPDRAALVTVTTFHKFALQALRELGVGRSDLFGFLQASQEISVLSDGEHAALVEHAVLRWACGVTAPPTRQEIVAVLMLGNAVVGERGVDDPFFSSGEDEAAVSSSLSGGGGSAGAGVGGPARGPGAANRGHPVFDTRKRPPLWSGEPPRPMVRRSVVSAASKLLAEAAGSTATDEHALVRGGFPPGFCEVWRHFRASLAVMASVGMEDLVPALFRLLQRDAHASVHLASRHRFVFVDEAQDCSVAELGVLGELAHSRPVGARCQTVLVGDTDQAIYAFRTRRQTQGWASASPDVFNTYARLCALRHGTTHLALTRNYRSRVTIWRAAKRLIAQNHQQVVDEGSAVGGVRSAGAGGATAEDGDDGNDNDAGADPEDVISVVPCPTAAVEAERVVRAVELVRANPIFKGHSIAVLARTSRALRECEKELRRARMPVTRGAEARAAAHSTSAAVGGTTNRRNEHDPYRDERIETVLRLLRAAAAGAGTMDDETFQDVCRRPRRTGLSRGALTDLVAWRSPTESLEAAATRALRENPAWLRSSRARALGELLHDVRALREMLAVGAATPSLTLGAALVEAARQVAAVEGLLQGEDERRHDFFLELVAIDLHAFACDVLASGAAGAQDQTSAVLRAFLRRVQAQAPVASPRDAVFVGTIHAAKGLEFDHVMLVRFNEGVVPLAAPTSGGASMSSGGVSQREAVFFLSMPDGVPVGRVGPGSAASSSSVAHGAADAPETDDGAAALAEAARKHVQEERRVAFVGITRARESLRLFFTQADAGRASDAAPSRFLVEMGLGARSTLGGVSEVGGADGRTGAVEAAASTTTTGLSMPSLTFTSQGATVAATDASSSSSSSSNNPLLLVWDDDEDD